jgi:hypothetical protein
VSLINKAFIFKIKIIKNIKINMENLKKKLQAQFDKMCATGKLFRSEITGQSVWDLYIMSFPPEFDPVFRDPNSSTHSCNLCNNFIRRYGNIVALDENLNIMSIWDIEDVEDEYKTSVNNVATVLRKAEIQDIFLETFAELNSLPYETTKKNMEYFQLGVAKNVKRYTREEAEKYGVVKPNEIRTFHHISLSLPKQFVDITGKSVESIMGDFRDAKNVFQRAMETISLDTLYLVRDLIKQGSLLDGQTHLHKIEKLVPLKIQYEYLLPQDRDNWCWTISYKLPIAKFRNEAIGKLCSDLSEGKEINEACQMWNKMVDPANYMKAIAPITKRQIEEAKKFVVDNGYEESFTRRLATLQDIKMSEILHASDKNQIKNVSIFDEVKSTSTRHKKSEFDKVEEISIEKFMSDVLPGCSSVEVFLQNNHMNNMVSLTTALNKESKPIFKWDNNYSWTFNGNLAGVSQIKETVKSVGGKVDGVLRFSIMWSGDGIDNSDLDAHCIQPDKFKIHFASRISPATGGNLDVDIRRPLSEMPKGAVENITFPVLNKMIDGVYTFIVDQYSASNSKGFKAEIEFNGEIYSYEYKQPVSGNIIVAKVTLHNGEFSIKHHLPVTEGFGTQAEIYGLETNNFHKVNLVCLSPNYWDNNRVGNKFYFFMLENCKTSSSIRSFHAENLIPELAQHRKVLEVLGNTTMIEPTNDKQLSGLGFNATVRNEVVVRLQGTHKRMLKIKF